jgi:hypothetical protein
MVYLGFPQTALDALLMELPNDRIVIHETYTEIKGFNQPGNFTQWKETIPLTQKNERKTENKKVSVIINKIAEYPIVNKTPIEAFNFLAEIKQDIENGQL